jgi:hypothetical protein
MGTLSKRPLRDFGLDLKDRIEDFRTSVGGKLDHMQDAPVAAKKHTMPPAARWIMFAGVFVLLGVYVEKSVAALRAR